MAALRFVNGETYHEFTTYVAGYKLEWHLTFFFIECLYSVWTTVDVTQSWYYLLLQVGFDQICLLHHLTLVNSTNYFRSKCFKLSFWHSQVCNWCAKNSSRWLWWKNSRAVWRCTNDSNSAHLWQPVDIDTANNTRPDLNEAEMADRTGQFWFRFSNCLEMN